MKSDKLERAKIIEKLDENLLVSASAGSGKTTILVERMVAIVEKGDFALSRMAALTFTKKAAGEFYDRFYKKLQLRIKPGFDYTKDDPYSLLGNPTPDAVKKDKEALAHIDTCFFGTIDAFYQKILSEHPLEASLSSNTTIIDDDEFHAYLIKKFASYVKSDDLNIRDKAEFFAKYVKTSSFPDLMERIISHNDLDLYQIPEDLASLKRNYASLLKVFKSGCKILVENESFFRTKKIDKDTLEEVDSTDKSRKSWEELIGNINLILSLKEDDYDTAKRIFKKINDIRFNEDTNGLLTSCDFVSNFAVVKTLNGKPSCFELKNIISIIIDKIIYINTIDFLTLVKDDIYNSMIKSGFITFSIATDCLLKLLRNSSEYQDTIDQIRSKIDCLLIDECQDTDMKQYEIFFRLTANDYQDNFKDLTIPGGKLYACGDRKQGIYHFRGADVSTFDYIKNIFEDKKEHGLPFDLVTLTDNHRSKGQLIQYFNESFTTLLASQGYPLILNDEIKDIEAGFGAFSYDTSKDDDPSIVGSIILFLHEKMGYKFKDFMVITSNKNNITRYSRTFSSLSIPSYSEGKIDIHVSSLLDVIINLFKYYASNKSDKISYLEILSSPLFNFDITSTIDLNHDYLSTFSIEDKKPHWPSDLLEKLASNQKIAEALNIKGIDVLIGFIHLLKEEENSGVISNYDDAIKYFQDLQKENLVIERLSLLSNNIDAVQIANAHKTKGLEKKVVFLTQAGNNNESPSFVVGDRYYLISHEAKTKNGKYKVIDNPDASLPPIQTLVENEKEYAKEENKRLLYVAATRAREYLFIANPKKKNGGGNDTTSKWYSLISPSLLKKGDYAFDNSISLNKKDVELKENKKEISINGEKKFHIIRPSENEATSIYDNEVDVFSSSRDDALVMGTMIHKLLESIVKGKDTILDDSYCYSLSRSYAREDLYPKLLEVKNTIYQGGYPQVNGVFQSDILSLLKKAKDVYLEVPFALMKGKDLIQGVMDVVFLDDNGWHILDYKTNAIEDVKLLMEKHYQEQMKIYQEALLSILGVQASAGIYHIKIK